MKFKSTLFGVLTTFLMLGVQAADLFIAGGGPSGATNRSTVILSAVGNPGARSVGNGPGQPVVHFLNATSDLASATIKFYRAGTPVKVTTASGSVTNVLGLSAADAAAFTTTNQIVVLQHVATDTYERFVNLTPTGNTIKLTQNTATTVAAGDLIYVCTQDGPGLFVGAAGGSAAKEYNVVEGVYAGEAGKPLLIELDGTTLCKLHYAAKYRVVE